MKSFKMSNLNTDAEGSPPPPPAPADPSVEAANAAVAAAAAAAAAAEAGGQYNDMYPTYNTYLMTRYSDQRYHTPSYTTQTPSYSSHISAHTSTDSGYYRYPDYSRYPYSGGNPSGPTSPRWRRRSYDPEYLTTSRSRNTGSAGSGNTSAGTGNSNNRPLSDLAASLVNSPASGSAASGTTSSVLMRSRSRSRVPSEYDPNAYLRYVSPSASSAYSTGTSVTRPMSGYIYGHSYIPTTTSLHNMPDPSAQPRFGSAPPAGQTSAGSTSANSSVGQTSGSATSGSGSVAMQPQPPPNYNAMDREVSARIRRYQADPSS